jgi:hypothetical protein
MLPDASGDQVSMSGSTTAPDGWRVRRSGKVAVKDALGPDGSTVPQSGQSNWHGGGFAEAGAGRLIPADATSRTADAATALRTIRDADMLDSLPT